jgi:nucleotide-binding universal stress UspA family protein
MVKKILIPLDGSALAKAALTHAENLAGASMECEAVLRRQAAGLALASDMINALNAESLEYLLPIRTKLQRPGIRRSFLVRIGAIAETILGVAVKVQAYINDWVVNHSPIPVLIIRPLVD